MDELKDILAGLPPVFGRNAIPQLLPGIISSKTLANLDSIGKGPGVYYKLGRRVFYERSSFIKFLLTSRHLTKIENDQIQEVK